MSDEFDTSDTAPAKEAEQPVDAAAEASTDETTETASDATDATDAAIDTAVDTALEAVTDVAEAVTNEAASDEDTPTTGDEEPEPTSDQGEELQDGEEPANERPAVTITADGDRIKSGDITVAGKHFADWFNQNLRPAHPGQHPTARPHGNPIDYFRDDVNKANFIETFNHCADLYAPQLTFNQFIAMFCIFYNETGGRISLVSEGDYLPTVEKRLRAAMRYNTAPNTLAGNQLAERGFLSDEANIKAWNTKRYPGPSETDTAPDRRALFEAAQECDFFKYRGRGLNQLTWRRYITMIVDPLLAAAGYGKTCDELTERELAHAIETDTRIGYGMTKSYFSRRDFLGNHFAAVDKATPDWSRVGHRVSGDPEEHGYKEIYAWRCQTLRAAMDEAGWQAD